MGMAHSLWGADRGKVGLVAHRGLSPAGGGECLLLISAVGLLGPRVDFWIYSSPPCSLSSKKPTPKPIITRTGARIAALKISVIERFSLEL